MFVVGCESDEETVYVNEPEVSTTPTSINLAEMVTRRTDSLMSM